MPNPVYISQITLPVGNSTITVNLSDATARRALAGGLSFNVCYDGTAEPVVANIPYGVVVTYQGEDYTGTKAASSAEALTFYLVKEGTTIDNKDIYGEYVAVTKDNVKSWEKIGDTQFDFSDLKALAYLDNVTLDKGEGADVLGASSVLSGADSAVSFSGNHSTDSALGANTTLTGQDSSVTITGTLDSHVLGADTTFEAADSSVVFSGDHTTGEALGANATFETSVSPSTTYLKATASGFGVASDGNDAAVVTGVSTDDDAFVDQLDVTSHKMKTVSIVPVASTEQVSAVSESHANLETTSVPVVQSAGSADTWAFNYIESVANSGSFDTLEITGANGSAMSLGSAATVATGATGNGGDAVVTGMTISDKTVAVAAADAVTLATGAIGTDGDEGSGATIVVDVDYDTNDALVEVESDGNEADAITGVTVTQPEIAMSTVSSEVSGQTLEIVDGLSTVSTSIDDDDAAEAITALASATAQAQSISIDTLDDVEAITTVGTAVAAAQEITVGSNDLVDVITGLASASAAAQTISVDSVNPDTVTVAEYDDLDITVS